MTEKSKKSLEDNIIRFILDKFPNTITNEHLYYFFESFSEKEINDALEELIEKEFITDDQTQTNRGTLHLDVMRKSYYLKNYPINYPAKKQIILAGKALPRILDGDRVRAEDINIIIEGLARYNDQLNTLIKTELDNQIKRIYKDLIVIFGIFVSVFSLIIISTEKLIRFDPQILQQYSIIDLIIKSSAIFLPIVIGLAIFIFLVWLITRK